MLLCDSISSAVFLQCVKMVKSAGSERVKTGFTGEGFRLVSQERVTQVYIIISLFISSKTSRGNYPFTIYQQQNQWG